MKDQLLLSISPEGFFIYFSLFTGLFLVVAVVVYVLLRSRRSRRSQFSGLGSVSKPTAFIVAAVLFLVPLSYFYTDSWSYFFTLRVEGDAIELGYVFPERHRSIAFSDITSVQASSHVRKAGTKYRLIVQTTDGEQYASQLLRKEELERVQSRLNDYL